MSWLRLSCDTTCGFCGARIVAGDPVWQFSRVSLRRCQAHAPVPVDLAPLEPQMVAAPVMVPMSDLVTDLKASVMAEVERRRMR